jgi:hypothetical protein
MLSHSANIISQASSSFLPLSPHNKLKKRQDLFDEGKAEEFIPPLPHDVKENYIYGYSWVRWASVEGEKRED